MTREDIARRRSTTGVLRGSALGLTLGLALGLAAGVALWAAHPPVGAEFVAFLVAPLLVAAMRTVSGGGPLDRMTPVRRDLVATSPALLAGIVGYGAMIAWLIAPAGVIGWALLVLIQALWLGLWAALVAPHLHRAAMPLLVAAAWVGMDMLRGLVPMSGFSWGALAYSQVDVAWFVPLGRTLGASGVTFVVVALSVALVDGLIGMWTGDREDPPRAPLVQAVGLALAVTLVTVGAPATQGSLDVLAVQGNDIEHWVRQDADPPRTITGNLHRMTLEAVRDQGAPDLVVWPESSIDRDPARPAWRDLGVLASEAAAAAGLLVAGVSLDGIDDPARERIVGAWLVGPEGTSDVRDLYIKRRPVPFGEYVPARRWLSWIPALDQVPRDAVAGAGAQAFAVAPGFTVAVVICFETLFSDLVRTNVLAGQDAGVILAITNDASFERSSEPDQHLAQSRMRAIETGRWVVHAALSGSSAFVDPEGRVHAATELFTQATIRRDVPIAVGRTPFLVLGDVIGIAGAAVLLLLALLALTDGVMRRTRTRRR
jgi:apolipoprotein N-acyltransferase